MNKNFLVVLLTTVMIMTACTNNGFKKTESGIEYKKHTTVENARQTQDGDVVLIQFSMGIKDSLLQEETPEFAMLVSPETLSPVLFEVFTLLNEGDSMTAIIDPIGFYGDANQIPPIFKENDKLYFNVKLNKASTQEEYEAEQTAKSAVRFEEETTILQDYMKQNNLKGETTESGLIIITVKEGKGEKPEIGKTVVVNYTGYLLDGTKFDSSFDHNEPFEFPIGQGRVIRGWDEGIATLKVGGKAKLLIPSSLAYGDRAMGDVIPANSPLIFDVELVKIK